MTDGFNMATLKLRNVDIFMLLNLLLFVFMCIFAYYDRFITYRGSENILEFFIYAVLIIIAIMIVGLLLRKFAISSWTLALVQIGILMHFFGGLGIVGESRLYNHYFFSLRYDKYVHFVNCFVAALAVKQLFLKLGLQLKRIENLVIILCVLGFGALFEIVEYLVTKTVANNGVGGYDNNMQDLIANLIGGVCYIGFLKAQCLFGKPKKGFKARG